MQSVHVDRRLRAVIPMGGMNRALSNGAGKSTGRIIPNGVPKSLEGRTMQSNGIGYPQWDGLIFDQAEARIMR